MNRRCLAFRANFELGQPDEHRDICPACARYAAALEVAARLSRSLAIPPALAGKLRALAEVGSPAPRAEFIPPAAPALPLPPTLAARLRAIPRRQAPPSWLLQPAASVAASLLLTVALTGLIGNPVSRVEPLARSLGLRARLAAENQAEHGKLLLQQWRDTAFGAVTTADGAGRDDDETLDQPDIADRLWHYFDGLVRSRTEADP